jgi:hypothetical protein
VGPEDGGPYVGQRVWIPTGFDEYFGWVPDEDLAPAGDNGVVKPRWAPLALSAAVLAGARRACALWVGRDDA